MNTRSLLPIAIALAVGIAIGIGFKPGFFEAESPQEQARYTPVHSDRMDSPASAPTRMPRPDAPASSKPVPARSSGAPDAEAAWHAESEAPRDRFASSALVDAERAGAGYRDEPFGPDEASLPFPLAVDETGAAADYAEYSDGPVRRDPTEPDDRRTGDERGENEPKQDFDAEACFPAFSACRKDTDCCGSSVCRSRPGTISGYFECTAS